MRLGEIKQKIDRVISENKIIVIEKEPLYGEQAQKVINYSEIIDVLEILSTLEWNDVQSSEISEQLLSKYPKGNSMAILPLEDFNKLSSFVARINEKLPIYYSVLDSMVEKQEEQVINIKLPGKIKTLENLSDFNNRISTLFKSFQVDGQFEFCKFDKGTDWYEIYIIGLYTYSYFIACLKVAQEYLKTKTEYFKSMEAEISYETAKLSQSNDAIISFDDYKTSWLKEFIKKEVSVLIDEKIKETNGDSKESFHNKLVMATTKLVKELGEGTEFHLSLNPPEYATEQAGQLEINYKKIQGTKKIKNEKQAQLDSPVANDK